MYEYLTSAEQEVVEKHYGVEVSRAWWRMQAGNKFDLFIHFVDGGFSHVCSESVLGQRISALGVRV